MVSRLPYSAVSVRLEAPSSDVWAVHYEALERQGKGDDIIVLSVGDPDFPTPHEITNYLVQQVHKGRTHYSPAGGEPVLLNALADLETRVEGRSIKASEFTVFPGATAALYSVFASILDEGDEVIIPEPMYIGYHGIFDALGVRIIAVPLDDRHEFSLDTDQVMDAVSERTRAVLVNTPGNPCGNILPGAVLEALAARCADKNLWLVCDEVYSLFTYDEPHTSLLKAASSLENVVVIDSLSKSHAMSGWRIGWAFAPEPLTAKLHRYCGAVFFGCSQFIQDASAFALSHNAPHILAMRSEYRKRRDHVVERVARMNNLHCFAPGAGMFVMLNVSACSESGDQFARRLLDEAGYR
ncbi:MAG: pyridoxal phosphate-dependent aminotransferase [Pseudomonadales bacterium]